MYNYNLINPQITKKDELYYIKSNNKNYILKYIEPNDLKGLELSLYDQKCYKLIKNRNNMYYIIYNKYNYILMLVDKPNKVKETELLNFFQIDLIYNANNNWIDLWTKKVDYIDEITKNVKEEIIRESKDYYIGLAENSILYLKNNYQGEIYNNYICRKRINNSNYRFPDNVIVDCKERDIAEYIKNEFFINDKKEAEIMIFLNKINIRKYNITLIFARLLFPTYYFDVIDEWKIGKDNIKQKINLISSKKEYYEKLLSNIEKNYLNNNRIEWLKKSRY